jgi:hypothetical protein
VKARSWQTKAKRLPHVAQAFSPANPFFPGLSRSRFGNAFGDQSRALFLRPREDRIHVRGRQHCIAMDPGIRRKRHSTILHLIRYLGKASLATNQRVFFPAGAVQVLSSFFHVAFDQPRDWRDVAVPRKSSSFRVTIPARALDDCAHRIRDVSAHQQRCSHIF